MVTSGDCFKFYDFKGFVKLISNPAFVETFEKVYVYCGANATCYEALAGGLGTPAINRWCGWDAYYLTQTYPTQPSFILALL